MQRRLTPELMDDPGVARDELGRSLGYIRWVNRRLGGSAALLKHLARWSRKWPRDRAVTVLDLATGSADIPVAVRRWGLARGFDIRITGVDLHETTLEFAREHVAAESARDARIGEGITLERGDALRLTERFGAGSFDYVHASLFLHHLEDVEALTVLRIMDRVSRVGIVWNDLHRSRLHRALVEVILVGTPRIVRHDARVSVEAGFTQREVEAMARRVGAEYARYHRMPGWYRFTLAGERPGRW
jgi:2-polyprenyl-3-methyl-5-hydroxy-6-metoxy-1,4-benzoquinol methylase